MSAILDKFPSFRLVLEFVKESSWCQHKYVVILSALSHWDYFYLWICYHIMAKCVNYLILSFFCIRWEWSFLQCTLYLHCFFLNLISSLMFQTNGNGLFCDPYLHLWMIFYFVTLVDECKWFSVDNVCTVYYFSLISGHWTCNLKYCK